MKKRLISIMLALCMVLCLVPTSVLGLCQYFDIKKVKKRGIFHC